MSYRGEHENSKEANISNNDPTEKEKKSLFPLLK